MAPDAKLIPASKMSVTRRKMSRTRLFSAWCYLRETECSIFYLKCIRSQKGKRHLLQEFEHLKIGDPKLAETEGSLALIQSAFVSSAEETDALLVRAHTKQHMNVWWKWDALWSGASHCSVSVLTRLTFFLTEHLFCFESESCSIAQAGLELRLSLPSTGVTSTHHHAWLLLCLPL